MQPSSSRRRRRVSCVIIMKMVSICLFLLVSIDSVVSANDLLQSICYKSQNPGECEKAFSKDPRSKTAAMPRELANICFDLAAANASKCVDSVVRLQTLNTTPPSWKPALERCANEFNYSAMEFRMGKEELKKDPMTASYDAFVSMDGAQRCDDAMNKDGLNLPQVTACGNNIRFFAFIAGDILDLVITP